MFHLNSWAILMVFILNWTRSIDSINVFNVFKNYKNKIEELRNETYCRSAYSKATKNITKLKKYTNLAEYEFFKRNESCFYFTIIEHKENPCALDGVSTLFYLKDSSEDSYLEEFINETLKKRFRLSNLPENFVIDTSLNNFVFGFYYVEINKSVELMWRDEKNMSIEISKYVKEYLKIEPRNIIRDDKYVRFKYKNTSQDTDYESDSKDAQYLFGCRFFYDSCFNNDACGSNGECVNHFPEKTFTCKCRSFYDGDRCEKWSNDGKQMLICIGLIVLAIFLTFSYKIISNIIRKIKYEKDSVNDLNNQVYKDQIKYNFKGYKLNIKHNLLRYSKKYPKLIIITILSLITSIFLILTKKNSLIDLFHTNEYYCLVKESFAEDYIFILIALPLTIVLYIINALSTKTIHLSTCRFTIYLKDLSEKRRHSNYVINRPKLHALKLYLMRFFLCTCSFVLPVPMNPFSKKNRLFTILIMAAYFYNITKILENVSSLPAGVNLTISDNCSAFFQIINNVSDQISFIKESIGGKFSIKSNTTTSVMDFTISKEIDQPLNYSPTEFEIFIENISKNLNEFQNFRKSGGILLSLLVTIVNVLTLGFAFYPILLCIEFKNKNIINYALCSSYIWLMLMVNFYLDSFCGNKRASFLQFLFTLVKCGLNRFINASDLLKANLNETNAYLDSGANSLEINIKLEKYFFYLSLCLLAVLLTTETIMLGINKLTDMFFFGKNENERCIIEYDREMEFTFGYIKNEIKYTRDLLIKNNNRSSFFRHLFEKYIYQKQPNYRYSKQMLSTCVFSLILVYYLTTNLLNSGSQIANILKKVIYFIFFMAMRIFIHDDKKLYDYMNIFNEALESTLLDIFYQSCVLTCLIYTVQVLLIVKNYHKHILNAYKNVFIDIPPPKNFTNAKLVSSSMHYSGYAVGYLLWGYSLSFIVMIILVGISHILFNVLEFMEGFVVILLPPLAIFVFRRFILWYASKFILTSNQIKSLRLRNRRCFLLLNHFNFFFDLFLISFLCFIRLIKSAITAAFYMPRLDYSIFGRYLEKNDLGFRSFVCFLHVEVNQTHPVKLSFLKYLLKRLNDQDLSEKTKAQMQARNKWFLAYTLSQNPSLKKLRKSHIYKEKYGNPKRETFGQFMYKNLNNIFRNLKKSKPTLNGKISRSKINIVNPVEMRPVSKRPDNIEILRLSSIRPIGIDDLEMSSFGSITNIDNIENVNERLEDE